MSGVNNWIFTSQELEHLPSLKDMDKQQEMEYRRTTCAFITQCGHDLKM